MHACVRVRACVCVFTVYNISKNITHFEKNVLYKSYRVSSNNISDLEECYQDHIKIILKFFNG